MSEKVEFRKVREFGDVIGDSLLFIKQNFKPLCLSFLCFGGVFILATFALNLSIQLKIIGASTGSRSILTQRGLSTEFFITYGLIFIVAIFSYVSVYLTTLSYIALYIKNDKKTPTIPEIWVLFKRNLLRFLGSGIFLSILFVLGLLFCVFPGIYLIPSISLFFPIMVIEDTGFAKTLNRAFRLPNNFWWFTFGCIFVISIIVSMLSGFIQIPGFLLTILSGITGNLKFWGNFAAIFLSIGSSLALFFNMISITGATMLYFNLVETKESVGLLNRMENFGEKGTDFIKPEEY